MNQHQPIGGYRDLLVWQKSMKVVVQVYQLTRSFPAEEKYGLVSQPRRAAVSIPSNIAEGQARHTTKEFINFLSISEGSVAELDTQLTLSVQLGFCPEAEVKQVVGLLMEVRKMLNGLRRSLAERV